MRETGSAAGVGGSGIQIALLKGAEHRWGAATSHGDCSHGARIADVLQCAKEVHRVIARYPGSPDAL